MPPLRPDLNGPWRTLRAGGISFPFSFAPETVSSRRADRYADAPVRPAGENGALWPPERASGHLDAPPPALFLMKKALVTWHRARYTVFTRTNKATGRNFDPRNKRRSFDYRDASYRSVLDVTSVAHMRHSAPALQRLDYLVTRLRFNAVKVRDTATES